MIACAGDREYCDTIGAPPLGDAGDFVDGESSSSSSSSGTPGELPPPLSKSSSRSSIVKSCCATSTLPSPPSSSKLLNVRPVGRGDVEGNLSASRSSGVAGDKIVASGSDFLPFIELNDGMLSASSSSESVSSPDFAASARAAAAGLSTGEFEDRLIAEGRLEGLVLEFCSIDFCGSAVKESLELAPLSTEEASFDCPPTVVHVVPSSSCELLDNANNLCEDVIRFGLGGDGSSSSSGTYEISSTCSDPGSSSSEGCDRLPSLIKVWGGRGDEVGRTSTPPNSNRTRLGLGFMEEFEDVLNALRLTVPSLVSEIVESPVFLLSGRSGFEGSGVTVKDLRISVLASTCKESIVIVVVSATE